MHWKAVVYKRQVKLKLRLNDIVVDLNKFDKTKKVLVY